MRVNNNYIRVVATFIGEDGSREFKKGTVYILKMKIKDSYIIVSSENNESLWCPYGSMNTFLENWKLADFIESENHNEENREGTLVFEHYNSYKGNGNCSELHKWIANNFNDFLKAIVNGYTVEKEKKYILKHIDMSKQYNSVSTYLAHAPNTKLQHESYLKDVNMSKIKQCHFTQSEIDKLNIGSYEQIEVIK